MVVVAGPALIRRSTSSPETLGNLSPDHHPGCGRRSLPRPYRFRTGSRAPRHRPPPREWVGEIALRRARRVSSTSAGLSSTSRMSAESPYSWFSSPAARRRTSHRLHRAFAPHLTAVTGTIRCTSRAPRRSPRTRESSGAAETRPNSLPHTACRTRCRCRRRGKWFCCSCRDALTLIFGARPETGERHRIGDRLTRSAESARGPAHATGRSPTERSSARAPPGRARPPRTRHGPRGPIATRAQRSSAGRGPDPERTRANRRSN